jgi:mannosidase alpha-like ER degradation enhancer 3
MRRAEADTEYARMCPNTLHLLPESVRRPLRNLVDGVCPRRSANRKLHASEFQVCIVKYFITARAWGGVVVKAVRD